MEACMATTCVACIVLIALVVLWRVTERAADQQMKAEVARIAASTSAAIDPVLHDRLREPSQIDTPLYEEAIRQLRRQLKSIPGVKYMYTAVLDEGKVRFVLDPAEPGDHDGDGREDRAQLWEEYADAEEVMGQAFGRGGAEPVTFASPEPDTDEWGTFVSGYAPVKRADGSVAAVVAVDIDAAEFVKSQRARWKTSLLAMMPGLTMSVAVGVGAFILRRQQLRALRDAEQTGEDAAQWASMCWISRRSKPVT
jgi:hypothetical protein